MYFFNTSTFPAFRSNQTFAFEVLASKKRDTIHFIDCTWFVLLWRCIILMHINTRRAASADGLLVDAIIWSEIGMPSFDVCFVYDFLCILCTMHCASEHSSQSIDLE